jgi:hypothetical protein
MSVILTGLALFSWCWYLLPGGRGTACDSPHDLYSDVPSLSHHNLSTPVPGPIHLFPPARACRGYGTEYTPDGRPQKVLLAEKTYPDPTAYLWTLLFVTFPLPISLPWQNRRAVWRKLIPR